MHVIFFYVQPYYACMQFFLLKYIIKLTCIINIQKITRENGTKKKKKKKSRHIIVSQLSQRKYIFLFSLYIILY